MGEYFVPRDQFYYKSSLPEKLQFRRYQVVSHSLNKSCKLQNNRLVISLVFQSQPQRSNQWGDWGESRPGITVRYVKFTWSNSKIC